MQEILIIDDDKELCELIKMCVQREGYIVRAVHTGAAGLLEAGRGEYTLIILDVMLPGIDGFSVLSAIREHSSVPVLMLSAKSEEQSKVSGLQLGADDYLTKPFGIAELMARVGSLIRRYTVLGSPSAQSTTLNCGSMTIDAQTRRVMVDNSEVELTGKEFDMLYFLASNAGHIYTKKQIYRQVWGEDYAYDDSNIMSFISKLRRKIETDAANPRYIRTIRGVGYRFEKGEEK